MPVYEYNYLCANINTVWFNERSVRGVTDVLLIYRMNLGKVFFFFFFFFGGGGRVE